MHAFCWTTSAAEWKGDKQKEKTGGHNRARDRRNSQNERGVIELQNHASIFLTAMSNVFIAVEKAKREQKKEIQANKME